jgi:adenylyltransferase/sulfurtransferase
VLGVLPGLVGTIQAAEVVKLVCGIGEPLVGRLLLVDALSMAFHTVAFSPDPRCPACGTRTISSPTPPAEACAPVPLLAEMTPAELAARRSRGEDLQILDVRERYEWDLARIEGARLAPLGRLDDLLPGLALDPARDLVVYCHLGVRSAAAARRLQQVGFARVWNLAGGIDRWSVEVDRGVPRY